MYQNLKFKFQRFEPDLLQTFANVKEKINISAEKSISIEI